MTLQAPAVDDSATGVSYPGAPIEDTATEISGGRHELPKPSESIYPGDPMGSTSSHPATSARFGAGDRSWEQSLTWTLPGASDHLFDDTGDYAGCPVVGDAATMRRIVPTVLNTVGGAHRPDAVVDAGFASPDLAVAAASVKGAFHHSLRTPRQDAYALTVLGDWLVAAIADGVGSAPLSHLAADRAVMTAVRTSEKLLVAAGSSDIDWTVVANTAREQVRSMGLQGVNASGAPEPTDRALATQMATTCDVLLAPVRRLADGSLPVTWVRISGDSSLYLLDPARGVGAVHLGKSVSASMVDNAVLPLPLDPGPPYVTSCNLRPGQAVVLCTDGIGDPMGSGAGPVGRYLYRQWLSPKNKLEMMETMSFVNKNAEDDRTAVVLWGVA